MSSSLFQLLVGVGIAVVAFILQQSVRWIIEGVLFRRRLVADIGLIVSSFDLWKPPAEIEFVNTTDGPKPDLALRLIWDYGYETLADVYSHSSNLLPDIFVRVVGLYSDCGKFDEIRCSYNNVVLETIKSTNKEPWVAVLNSHLRDMSRVVKEIVVDGHALLDCISDQYSFESRAAEVLATPARQPALVGK